MSESESESESGFVVLATCADFPEGDEDDGGLVAACRQLGIVAEWRVWDDPAVDWQEPRLVVVRSTWDYTTRRSEFLSWAGSVANLANPAEMLRWNSDKVYLLDLEAASVPVVPTQVVPAGRAIEPPTGGGGFVVKPSVGAGSRGVGRFALGDPDSIRMAETHAAHLRSRGRTVILQPYLDLVDTAGETAVLFFGGLFSHAVRKGPMLPASAVHRLADPRAGSSVFEDRFLTEEIEARHPSAEEMAVAERALAAIPGGVAPLYARVDLLPTPDGPVVTELELIEPSLFLGHAPGAVGRMAQAIADQLAGQ